MQAANGSFDIAALAARVTLPDETTRRAAQALADARSGLGRLGEVAVWLAAVQGRSPAKPFERIRVLALPAQEMEPDAVALDVPAEAEPAFQAGLAAADAQIDGGADLIVLTGGEHLVPATAVVALLAGKDVASVVGHRPGTDDRDWMRMCADVRDTARRGRARSGDVAGLLAALPAPEVAVAAGVITGAATRRTPVLIDELVPSAAALVTQRISFRVSRWLAATHRTTDPAHSAALDRMRLAPLLDYGMADGTGLGTRLAIPHLQVAAQVLAEA
ncbi:MAG TPA: nicotinate-nucleotide--dimethylbenzimidazole phosphoribosyltransferase [Jiangellales bacterium]|nr:nicotinate-nucleotide--dimethylbenzimidazole phosphoribosyltransferase [Jiangellales bacterium]